MFYKSDINKNKDFQHVFFLICNKVNNISKFDKDKKYPLLCEEFENEKKKEQKNVDLPEQGFEPQIFSNFPANDLNFHVR